MNRGRAALPIHCSALYCCLSWLHRIKARLTGRAVPAANKVAVRVPVCRADVADLAPAVRAGRPHFVDPHQAALSKLQFKLELLFCRDCFPGVFAIWVRSLIMAFLNPFSTASLVIPSSLAIET